MGSEAKKTHGALGRTDLFFFDPNDLVLVTDPKHPLFDERVNLPIDERIVLSIMKFGVLEPVVVRKNGESKEGSPIIELVDGRQRVRCAREANKRLAESGSELIRVPATITRKDDGTLFGVMIATNEGRKQDGPLVKARKIQRYMDMGRDIEEAAITFCCSKATIKNHLLLLDLDDAVQRAIEAGRVGVTIAKKLSALPREEQVPALLKIIDANAHAAIEACDPSAVAAEDGAAPDLAHVALSDHSTDADASKSDAKLSKENAGKGPKTPKASKAKAAEAALEKALDGRGKVRSRSVKTKAQIEAAREAIKGSRSEASAAFDAALCWVLSVEGALEGLPHIAKRLEGLEE